MFDPKAYLLGMVMYLPGVFWRLKLGVHKKGTGPRGFDTWPGFFRALLSSFFLVLAMCCFHSWCVVGPKVNFWIFLVVPEFYGGCLLNFGLVVVAVVSVFVWLLSLHLLPQSSALPLLPVDTWAWTDSAASRLAWAPDLVEVIISTPAAAPVNTRKVPSL